MNITALRRSTLVAGLSLAIIAAGASPAIGAGGAGLQIYVNISQYSPAPRTLTLDVEGSDSIENVKQKVEDVTYLHPPEMCLVYEGTLLQDGLGYVIDQYGIEQGATLDLYTLPVVATWSITPDEPYLGGTVSNVPITHPGVTHASVASGALPDGVTLNADTGLVEGTFNSPGAFDVTLEVETLCGTAELTWSGVVTGRLPDTGFDASNMFALLFPGLLALGAGVVIIAIGRRRA